MATGVEAATAWQSFGAAGECVDARRECAPDFELARRAAGGDMEAFERIYRLHHKRVYSLCLRMTGNVAEAEDLAQEVFVHLFR
ncbi:MAG: RNA polymerase sigma factor, partial [Pyrinomonadaceae bacterium]